MRIEVQRSARGCFTPSTEHVVAGKIPLVAGQRFPQEAAADLEALRLQARKRHLSKQQLRHPLVVLARGIDCRNAHQPPKQRDQLGAMRIEVASRRGHVPILRNSGRNESADRSKVTSRCRIAARLLQAVEQIAKVAGLAFFVVESPFFTQGVL